MDGGNPSESIGFILRREILFDILMVAFMSTASHVSYIGSDRMTVSVVNCIYDAENMGFDEIEKYSVNLLTISADSMDI